MKVVCAWCGKKMGEKPPYEDRSTIHGMCPQCFKKEMGSSSMFKSAQRLVEGEQQLKETGDPIWIGFLKRESGILLQRAFKFWWMIRFRR